MSLWLYSRFSFKPVVAVEVAVADGFCHVLALDLFRPLQVGNRAAHLQDAVVGTGREIQPAHGHAQLFHTRIVEHGILLKSMASPFWAFQGQRTVTPSTTTFLQLQGWTWKRGEF